MDIAYDHITEETFSSDRASTPTPQKADASSSKPNLNTEFQETFRAFSNSPWGAKLGGLWGNVRKQGEQYYEGARKEVEGVSEEALKGLSDLKETIVKQTQSLSLDEEKNQGSRDGDGDDDTTPSGTASPGKQSNKKRTESEIIRDNDSLISKFRNEAAKRLKDIEKAEDAADEALLRFGTNIRNFLRDAVAIAPPSEDAGKTKNNGSVLFESKDSTGKRVIHTTRFDAQLHVIHSTFDSFRKDPVSGEWQTFKDDFRTDEKTDDISQDLDKYPDLRKAMEQLVPEKVDYKDFWCRYYFLRLVIETEEQKRKELLKGDFRSLFAA
jgi:BSD domain